MVFDLGTRLHVHMHTKLHNDILLNGQQPECLHVHMHTKLQNDILLDGQQPECCEWFLFTRGNMKMLSDRSALPSPMMRISSLLKRQYICSLNK